MKDSCCSNKRPLLLCALIFGVGMVSFAYLADVRHELIKEETKEEATIIEVDDLEPCTFEQLQDAFSPQSDSSSITSEGDRCWSLEDEIMRIPAAKIANRDYMPKLGHGCLGGVYKAAIQLRDPHKDVSTSPYCSAALKTDDCYHLLDNPVQDSCKHGNAHSCAAEDGVWNYKTFMGGEYTGALPWYAQLATGKYQKGLLPTWAVVQDEEHPMKHWLPRKPFTTSVPHTDPSLKGVIMPLIQMHNLQEPFPAVETARIMLPAAEGLVFLSDMGLAVQDMAPGNVGLSRDAEGREYAFIFDYSYMGVDPKATCEASTSDDENFSACQFCHEDVFPVAQRVKGAIRGVNALKSDFILFRNVILDYMLDREAPLAANLEKDLNACETPEELTAALREFIAKHSSPVEP